ncbi:type VI secretion system protein TssA [Diaphorobacter aerolatus]|uniref:type VI secretion system protein TssA n=1 Tax=Diaphorobacter aerolatus TaxID=1288495 RepID=UPI001D007B63|nr:type VI secretion system ImpA family N-terminal domain-containing protein [Diaphorobacter aerolatus]
MLTQDVIDALLTPVSEGSPCGDDLEYDAAFISLESAAKRKPEQQFGDTLIPAVEPEWPQVQEQAIALLSRTKDLRPCVLLLRASTRLQGVAGFVLGLQLLTGLLERYWSSIHPALDADDDNEPTMRLNALAPLGDDALVVRDLHHAVLGDARGVGLIRVRDVAIARNVLSSNDATYSASQVEGALRAFFPTTAMRRRRCGPPQASCRVSGEALANTRGAPRPSTSRVSRPLASC